MRSTNIFIITVLSVFFIQGIAISMDTSIIGSWKLYSSAVFYDKGGSGAVSRTATRLLEIKGDGKWSYGSSSGKWHIRNITDSDWKAWNINPFGPTTMIILEGWSKGQASGPMVEGSNGIDFIWIIYPSTGTAGTVQMKFGRSYE